MAKNDNLKDFLTDVADAIREKKGSTDLINPQDFSSEIASIQSGGDIFGFDTIGYTLDNNSIKDDIAYSQELLRQLEGGEITTFQNKTKMVYCPKFDSTKYSMFMSFFFGCTSMVYFPSDIPTSHITIFEACWQNCSSLVELYVDTSNATTIRSMVVQCSKLKYVSPINCAKCSGSSATSQVFYNCSSLLQIEIFNTGTCVNFSKLCYGCKSLTKLTTLDLASATSVASIFLNCTKLAFISITNLGKSSLATYDFSGATNWGVATTDIPDARQSLIDSLITYSYDRASNGMATATIKLSATTKALLTEEEIAQITAKGFTIA